MTMAFSSLWHLLCVVSSWQRRDFLQAMIFLPHFRYSNEWTGTALPLLDLETAVRKDRWDMGRWPDPILRRPATPVDKEWFGTRTLRRASQLLEETSERAGAVGLAAQQCGVDARMVYLQQHNVMVNPRIVQRAPETDVLIWREECLVLPPTFRATVLRDAWIDVAYADQDGQEHTVRFRGETARAAQHELDHDRGILIVDHVGMEELENDVMRNLEKEGHSQRMALAYARYIQPSETISSSPKVNTAS